MNREIIYAKDIQIITGKCLKSSRRLLKKMKSHFGKAKHQYINIRECSDYFGIRFEDMLRILH